MEDVVVVVVVVFVVVVDVVVVVVVVIKNFRQEVGNSSKQGRFKHKIMTKIPSLRCQKVNEKDCV